MKRQFRLFDHLKQIVYGGNDGIVTTFAIVAGFAGANADGVGEIGTLAVLVFGLANLFADAVSMGMGEFLSARAARDMLVRRRANISADPSGHIAALSKSFQARGYSSLDATTLASLAAKNPEFFAELSLAQIEGLEDPGQGALWPRALITFLSFVCFGFVPLFPFIFHLPTDARSTVAALSTIGALTALGILRHVVTRAGLGRAVGETLLVGGLCAIVAYLVGVMVGSLG